MASTYLTRTPSSASNQNTFTISTWVKKCNTTGNKTIFSQGIDNGEFFSVRLDARGYLGVFHLTSAGYTYESILSTQRVLRDNNAFYHIVVAVDTTQATASDRTKIYINGNLITDFVLPDENVYPNQNFNSYVNTTNVVTIGAKPANGDNFDGVMSHFHFIDGTQYQASDFGEYDANGVWKIKTDVSVTYGTNGFFILKDGNSVTDQSGNGNNFTVGGGTLTNTEDNPSNVFCTLNPLDKAINATQPTFSYGNTQWTASGNGTSNCGVRMTLGASSGKYYFEAKLLEATYIRIGVHLDGVNPIYNNTGYIGNNTGYYAIYIDDSDNIYAIVAGSNQNVNLGSVTNNDIIGCAFDFDNNKFYFSKNGTWLNSGDPTSGATGTGSFGTLASGLYVPAVGNVEWSVASNVAFNFGNGYFGTTAVASAGTNASGIGIFEYDVPTGYTALSTKGLNL